MVPLSVLALAATVSPSLAGPSGPAGHRTAAQNQASSPSYAFLYSAVAHVKTSNHRNLHMSVSASAAPGRSGSVSVTLTNGSEYVSGETHLWTFQAKAGTFSYSHGKGRVATGKQMGKYGLMDLSFRKKSQSTSQCAGGQGTVTRIVGSLHGKVFLNTETGSHGWGTAGSKHRSMTFSGKNTISILSSGCPIGSGGGSTPPCTRGTFWSAPYANGLSIYGSVVKAQRTVSTITATRSVTIAKPAGASRLDEMIAKEPAPAQQGSNLQITTSGTAITGGATISGSSPSNNSYQCKVGGQSHTEHNSVYTGSWSPKPSSALAVHFQATGRLSGPQSGTGSFTTASY